ncbi:hypothetical protein GGR51DRAFT_540833 [Nemania sp. FL0031]|nr:hypothetical protein GGR51DRAFT_540833 [Nemania sp. FL0031]
MFTVRSSHGRALYSPLRLIGQRSLSSSTCNRFPVAAKNAIASRFMEKSVLNPDGPVAEQLAATGVWKRHGGNNRTPSPTTSTPKRRSKKALPTGDKARLNIVGDKLCDDILSYIGPSLRRHRGCDILDIYPGAGVWSSKLHEFLKPRSHVLLEPDAELYRPFLQPLLDKPGTRLVPKSGIIWRELSSILTPEYFPHQVIPENPDARNDTLLVTANLAFHPKKRFLSFDSIAALVLHQFVDAIRSGTLFQRYGRVRMLIWTRTDDKLNFIPRVIQRRRRQAIDNDLLCEWIQEVCGGEAESASWFARDEAIDNASLIATVKRMQSARLFMPPGREPEGFAEAVKAVRTRAKGVVPGKKPPTFKRPYLEAYADLQAANADDETFADDEVNVRFMNTYRWRVSSDERKAERLLEHTKALDKIVALYKKAGKNNITPQIEEAEREWVEMVRELPNILADEFRTYRDNLHAFRQKPPLLQWDKRQYEPMAVQPSEFFPNVPCSLIDIQPRAPHPLLRQTGANSNRAADMFEVILGQLMHQSTQPVGSVLDSLWPGAADYIMPRWESALDVAGGSGFLPHVRCAEPLPRLLNSRQWEELLELWMEWPFRPEFYELLGRTQDDLSEQGEDGPLALEG